MPPSVKAVDDIGAGDSFDAGFVQQYLTGAKLEDCLALPMSREPIPQQKKVEQRRFVIVPLSADFFRQNWSNKGRS